MKKPLILILMLLLYSQILAVNTPTAEEILQRVDDSQNVEKQVILSSMVIHSVRGSRTIKYKSWIIGQEKSFTESLAPAREKAPRC